MPAVTAPTDTACRPRGPRLLGGGLAALLLFGSLAAAQDMIKANRELEQVRSRIQAIQRDVEREQGRRDDLSQALATVEREIGALGKRLHGLKQDVAARQSQIEKLDARRRALKSRLGGRLDQLSGQLRSVYMNGQQSKLRVLLSQDSPEKLGRMLAYYDYLASAQVEDIRLLRQQAAELIKTRKALTAERDALQEDQSRLQATLVKLEETETERERALTAVEQTLASRGRDLQSARRDETQLQNLIAEIRKKLASVDTTARAKPLQKSKGRLTAPVAGRTLARFGQSKPGSNLRWQGVWLQAGNGDPVRAAAPGRVVYVGWMHRYGLIAVLDHGNDFFTLYGHAQSVYPEVGDWIEAGQVIAAAGNSGGHRQTGVYFEIRQGRKPLDPAAWLPRG